jgi:ribosome-associated translation inhibitor RaiA
MALEVQLHTGDLELGEDQERRIRHQLEMLGERLTHFSEPTAYLTLRDHPQQRRVTVDLRAILGPRGNELVSHQAAETAEHAVRLAIEDVERQLERFLADLRGEPTYGVPSRRLPDELRPNPPAEGA